jgi:hypothetical protein
MNKFFTLLFCIFFFPQALNAKRFLYVDDFKNILDNATRRTALLEYAKNHQIDELILYELHLVNNVHNLSNATTNQILADFINNAKTNYGVSQVSAAGETANWFQNNIMTYNSTRSVATEKFDALGLEFEFWTPSLTSGVYCTQYLTPNGLTCDNAGGFTFCINQLTAMKTMTTASSHPMLVEMYTGWPNQSQLQALADVADRTFIHAYVQDPSNAYTYALTRLQYFDTYANTENVYIIFSSEPVFMQSWLNGHSMVEAESIFSTAYNAASGVWKSHVNLEGFVYFTYTMMENVPLPLAFLTAKGEQTERGVELEWQLADDENLKHFDIERSEDGRHWLKIATVDKTQRSFCDKKSIFLTHYYKINALTEAEQVEQSFIVTVNPSERLTSFLPFPNPFTDIIELPFNHLENAYLIDMWGQAHKLSVENNKIKDLENTPKGLYCLKILRGGKWLEYKMVKQ